jgi:hypothetical protein
MQRQQKAANAPSRVWKYLSWFLICTVLPWAMYLQFREKADQLDIVQALKERSAKLVHEIPPMPTLTAVEPVPTPLPQTPLEPARIEKVVDKVVVPNKKPAEIAKQVDHTHTTPQKQVVETRSEPAKMVPTYTDTVGVWPEWLPPPNPNAQKTKKFVKSTLPPVVGPVVTNGSQPLWGLQHKGTDAIMALACKYPVQFYKRFVGTLRKFGFTEDIVFAVSTVATMKPGVEAYLKSKEVLSYGFDVECAGSDNCRFTEAFLGYPDPRPYRTFANIRYALYEYWLEKYEPRSYVLILDFRDTFFQGNPMGEHLPFASRVPKYDLRVFAENFKVKQIGNCVFNSMWVRKCFGKSAFDSVKANAVLCSGSTYGSYPAVHHYVRTMLTSFDKVQCWKKGIESDQGYQSYLYYSGAFNTPDGNATKFDQGEGVVNTIGALNGFRVPKHMKGPLDTHWHIRDSDGYILNNDGTRSVCIHQWDRWYADIAKWLDTKLLGED